MLRTSNVKKLFDKIEKNIDFIKQIKAKEKSYISNDFRWGVYLHYGSWSLIKKWNVCVEYEREIVMRKSFRKYEDALKFYEECVKEAKRRWE